MVLSLSLLLLALYGSGIAEKYKTSPLMKMKNMVEELFSFAQRVHPISL
jgi:hypothetical protein